MNILAKDKLELKTSSINELNELNIIHNEACEYFSFDENHNITSPSDCLTIGDLPPNGTKDNFYILSVYENNQIIGYTTLYKGFPSKDTLYICFMYISSKKRGNGYGYSIVESISSYFKANNYKNIKISVSLKNWQGIRFWNKCGFSTITNVDIDGPFGNSNYGSFELEKII